MEEHTVEIVCGGGNEYDGRMGLRVSSIFVIGFGSMIGMFFLLAYLDVYRENHLS